MAQRKELSWTELRVGVFVLLGLVILALAIFYVTGAGTLGPKVRLITYMPEVEGLETGAPVRLAGVGVGIVQSVALTPTPSDEAHNITVVMRVDRKFQNEIRTDSRSSLLTEGLLGNRYVTISRGLTGTVVPADGVVQSEQQAEMKDMIARGVVLEQNLTGISNDLKAVIDDIHEGKGTVGKLIADPSLYNHLDSVAEKFDGIASDTREGKGTVGKLLYSDDLYNKANSTIGHLDDVIGTVRDQKGTVGKLFYDPALYNNLNGVMTDVRAGKGTLGKLYADDTLYNNLRDTSMNLRDATGKMNTNQGTIGKLFTDPALYDNMTSLTGDMRLMVNDFRQNPKKFLHIKLGLF
jgi:phospholipid/cholesterol/gamma-HCH transport system substrate-binding protein